MRHTFFHRYAPTPRGARLRAPLKASVAALISTSLLAMPVAHAGEREDIEQLRATTMALIQALIDQGLLTRERADALLKKAEQARPAAVAVAPAASASAAAEGGPAPAVAATGTVRVPYIPESLKAQIKEDVRNDVLATARAENWADSRQIPAWVKGLSVEGDVRVRLQDEVFDKNNLGATIYRQQVGSPAWSPDLDNTTTNRTRMTLRARVGVNAKLSEDFRAGVRIATGGTTGQSSESSTLGNYFNRSAIGLDRGFVRWEPSDSLRMEFGRTAVPFFGTDLLWPDDLAVDGGSVHAEKTLGTGFYLFGNAGAFAAQELALSKNDKWLYGVQLGANWALGNYTELRVGAASYDFYRLEGTRADTLPPSGAAAATTPYLVDQYPAGVRQKGNTLINLCPAQADSTTPAPCANGGPVWGLASKFRPVNLTAALTLRQFDPYEWVTTLDYVHNSGFDLADIQRRAGDGVIDVLDKKVNGWQLRTQFGTAKVSHKADWQAFIAMRQFERDAWVDAFTDTTWHLGGTGYKGFSIGGSYGLDRNASLGLRWTSTRNLDDGRRFGDPAAPIGDLSSAPLKIDVLQMDISARF